MKRLKSSLKKLRHSQNPKETEPLVDLNFKRTAYLQSFPKVLVYCGYDLPGDVINSKVLDDLQDFDVKATDVLIISYPQSGTTFAEDIVCQLVDRKLEKNPSGRERDKCQVAKLEANNPYGHIRWLRGLKSPRVLSSSLPYPLLPEGVRTANCKIIYLIRNPKDQSVSYYYQHRVKGILSSFDDFFHLFLSGHLLYGDYFSHVIDFWQLFRNNPKNVLFISFEELRLETNETIKRIVDFLEYDLTEEDINQLPINLAKQQKTTDKTGTAATGSFKQYQFEGVIGDWNNYFTPKQSQQIDAIIKKRFESIGLNLCCEPIEAVKRLSKFKRIIIDTTDGKKNAITEQTQKVRERPKLNKEEIKLARHDIISKIDIIDEPDPNRQQWNDGCFLYNWFCCCCPCLFKRLDYTNA